MANNHLQFGTFIPPLHKLGVNPHLALSRDLELIEHLENLGLHEVWVGEHHSSGIETIGSPEVFLAAAGQRTHRIKLGTGVNSLPYHHPLLLADRIVLLDHLTRGRMMFGAGPGQLPLDAAMPGIDVGDSRRQMDELLDVMMRLFNGERSFADTTANYESAAIVKKATEQTAREYALSRADGSAPA